MAGWLAALPGPVRRIGAWRDATEAKEPGNTPWSDPEVKNGDRGPKDRLSGRTKRRAGRKHVRKIMVTRIKKRAVRRGGPANPMKI